MTRSSVRAFARAARRLALAAVGLALGAGALHAQATGKIEGHVRDQSGAPVASAQVVILGTAFVATANGQGYYFINNVPAGAVDLKAVFVGYRAVTATGLRVLSGQTMTQDFVLEATPIEIEGLVTTAENPLVPRDNVSTKQIVEGEFVNKLPITRLQDVLTLQPGVLQSGTGGNLTGLQIRGGRGDESATYVDGVPTSPGFRGTTSLSRGGGGSAFTTLTVAPNSFEDASVTTGAVGAEFGNAQSGVVNIQTRTGGRTYSGQLRVESDAMLPSSYSQGASLLQASIGGPITKDFTFLVSGQLQGSMANDAGFNAQAAPQYVRAGVDSVMNFASSPGSVVRNSFVFPKWAAYTGDCNADYVKGSANSGIADNYGLKCQGVRVPNSASSNYNFLGKLNYTYGTGSRFSLTGLTQQGVANGAVDNLTYGTVAGTQLNSRGGILNWVQNLSKSSERALALDVSLSAQQDKRVTDNLTQESERAHREPFMGFTFKSYGFVNGFNSLDINDDVINNVIRGDVIQPYNQTYLTTNPYRIDPYGGGANGNASSSAPSSAPVQTNEKRYIGKANLDWQLDRYNRLRLGGEMTKYDLRRYTFSLFPTSVNFGEAYIEKPTLAGLYAEETLDVGDVVIKAGLRYDYFNSNALRPYFGQTVDGAGNPTGGGYAFPTTFTHKSNGISDFDPTNPTKFFVKDQSHDYVSPHVQVSFPVTQSTNFRLSYAHEVQAPDLGLVYAGLNNDQNLSNSNQTFGTDLDFGKTILFEFGIRHSFGPDMVLDLSAYNKDKLSDVTIGIENPVGPDGPQQVRFARNADFGNVRGIDVRLDRRFGAWFNGSLAYTFQQAKSTGTDPFSYVSFYYFLSNGISSNSDPAKSAFTTSDNRPQNLTGALALTTPSDWKQGSTIGAIFRSVSATATFRFASGLPYTTCPNDKESQSLFIGTTAAVCGKGKPLGDINGSRLPMYKAFDLRVAKGFRLGHGLDLSAYAVATNLFNFQTQTSVYRATGGTSNPTEFNSFFNTDSTSLYTEVSTNVTSQGKALVDGSGTIDLRDPTTCQNWVLTSGAGGMPSCFALYRAEERFGNGDHLYTEAEYKKAFTTSYNITRGLNNFIILPRRVRLGLELTF
ncbi:MAG TPA: TonB-dependent receptor [Gemmatimonadales bacterium]|nr:TonB-dependent receptor [Gemmatimonadales bacterium]